MEGRLSEAVEFNNRSFRYNYTENAIEWVAIPTEEDLLEDAAFRMEHNHGLLDLDSTGCIILDTFECPLPAWENSDLRNKILLEISGKIDEMESFFSAFLS